MGMFDYLRCQYPLPDGFLPGELVFQTKDMDNSLSHFTLTSDGRVMGDRWHYEIVPESARPFPNHKGIKGCAGSLRVVTDEANVDWNHHGPLNFYAKDADGLWREYHALFDGGQLVSMIGGVSRLDE